MYDQQWMIQEDLQQLTTLNNNYFSGDIEFPVYATIYDIIFHKNKYYVLSKNGRF